MTGLASKRQLRASLLRWALFAVPLVLLLGFLSGQVGSNAQSAWFQSLTKPAIFPPPVWFAIVWSVLYAMMGLALAMICAAWGARGRTAAIAAFAVQLAINLAWSPVFFAMHRIREGLIVISLLDLAVIVTIVLFWRVRRGAALLLLPYLVWIAFATLLNWEFLQANPDGGNDTPSGAVQRYEF
jgi:tryptophan-rich sensory protein